MEIYNYRELQEKMNKMDNKELYKRICKNIKRMRKARYEEFKRTYHTNKINPYTTENIADLLDYNHNHYKRFESDNDSTKRIPLEKLLRLAIIFDTTIDEIIK